VSRGWRGGSTRAYRVLRDAILERDGHSCRIALPGTWVTRYGRTKRCMGTASCVHHTHGRAVTGDDPRFMVAACTPCNLKVGDPTKHRGGDPPGRGMTQW
jgi:hypothetical protein